MKIFPRTKPLLKLFFSGVALLFSLGVNPVYSQKDSVYDRGKQLEHNGNLYKVYNNWISGGAGYGFSYSPDRDIFHLGLDYNFHIKWHYFRTGFFLSGRRFGDYDNTNFHACYVLRKETIKYNFSGFAGPSHSSGFRWTSGKPDYKNVYREVGLLGGVQAVWKLKYDVGLGLSLIGDWNKYQSMVLLRADLYLSGAYAGKKSDRNIR